MEELIARVTQKTGLDADTARKAIGIILAYLRKEGPDGGGQPARRGISGRRGRDRDGANRAPAAA